MTAGDVEPGQRSRHSSAKVLLTLLALVTVGCSQTVGAAPAPTLTPIPQPTPNPTMDAVIKGQGAPVAFLPPLEIRGSPTPITGTSRSGTGPAGGRSAPKPTSGARDAGPPSREPGPAAKPAPTAPTVRSLPTAQPAARPTATRTTSSGGSGSAPSGSGGAPAIINPNTALPGSSRPNPTPGR